MYVCISLTTASSFPPQKNPQRLNCSELYLGKKKKEKTGSWFWVGGGLRRGERKLRKEAKGTELQKLPCGFLPPCILSSVYSHPTRGKPSLDLPTLPASLPLIPNVPIILPEPGPNERSQKEL